MQRREFMKLAGTVALCFARPGYAQTKPDLPLIGLLFPGREEALKDRLAGLRLGLQQAGLVEGKNYSLVIRFANGDLGRLTALAKELGEFKPKVVVVGTFPNLTHKAIPDVPIIFSAFAADPVAMGIVDSWVRPGGMITGNVMNAVGGEETMAQKRGGLFKQLVPGLTRLGMIGPDPGSPLLVAEREALQKVAVQFGFDLKNYGIAGLDNLESAFASARRDDVNALFISGEPLTATNMSRIMPFVTASGKPSFGPYLEMARAGLLMSYSSDLSDGFRHAGIYAAKILGGAKPGDLPIEQASKFIFAINLKTAKALGITVPPNLLALADEVLE
jgi:putative tryptophan/tyrosine transport system substrate-binding protein